jgi:tetratricopeptide (TPR) repeat protein
MHVYGTRDLQRLFGISASSVRSLVRAGHVKPRKGLRGRLEFSFQDLIVLRSAHALGRANVSTRRLNRCLRQLRQALPASVPLSGLSVTAIGDTIAVREGKTHRDPESGQLLLALDVRVEGGELKLISRGGRDAAGKGSRTEQGTRAEQDIHRDQNPRSEPDSHAEPGGLAEKGPQTEPGALAEKGSHAEHHFASAFDLEEHDPAAAVEAYRRCLALSADHPEARLNCGRLLHMSGRHAEAEQIYRGSPEPGALLLFNLAVLLEDLGRVGEAIQAYRQALELDPQLADAHFNLARLFEMAGNRRDSFRHLLAYRRNAGR